MLIIPRTAGVSSSSTQWRMRRKPRPRTVARCDALVPITLFTSVTFTVFSGFGLSALAAFLAAAGDFRAAFFTAGLAAFFAAGFFAAGLAAFLAAGFFSDVFFGAAFFAALFFVVAFFAAAFFAAVFFSAMVTPESLRQSCRA